MLAPITLQHYHPHNPAEKESGKLSVVTPITETIHPRLITIRPSWAALAIERDCMPIIIISACQCVGRQTFCNKKNTPARLYN